MPRVTALRVAQRDRVRVELDGEPWRTLPAAAVVAAGLSAGVELDRPRARALRRALRRSAALSGATAALARRDRSTADLDAELARRGVGGPERAGALETMARLGYLDDRRFAHGRAAALARRGYGDEAIRFDLAQRRVPAEQVEPALAALAPEPERARGLLARLQGARSARALAARGFSAETIESVLGVGDG